MNSKQERTLATIFRQQTPADLAWTDLEGLLLAVGCRIVEGEGSRVRFVYGTQIEIYHRPHPAKKAKRYQVRQARDFLLRIGVKP